jgi:hypothetical protein
MWETWWQEHFLLSMLKLWLEEKETKIHGLHFSDGWCVGYDYLQAEALKCFKNLFSATNSNQSSSFKVNYMPLDGLRSIGQTCD